jgi:ribosomal protein S18 acetylase RimI-like enzyme
LDPTFPCSYSKSIWNELIQAAISDLEISTAKHLLAIPISPWFSNLLANNGFKEVSRVIVLNLDTRNIDIAHPKSEYMIRDMQISDIQEIEKLDRDSFGPVWHNTKRSLEAAFSQAYKATVVLEKETIIGYQISTISSRGIHLARLAIQPAYQSKGIASTILSDLIKFLNANNKKILSVNTQQNNVCSKNLYKKFGFQPTNEYFQVFGIRVNK